MLHLQSLCVLMLVSLADLTPLVDLDSTVSTIVNQTARELVDTGKVVGLSIGVVQGDNTFVFGLGKLSKAKDALFPDGRTMYEIGSISKVFTTSLLAECVERGEVNLDDPLSRYVPDGIKVPSRNEKPISFRHLATHSSGLPRLPSNLKLNLFDPYRDYSPEDLYSFLDHHELRRDPGELVEYSNYGVGLLGHTLARRVGKEDYEALLVERICTPLGMSETRLRLDDAQIARFSQGYSELGIPAGRWEILTLGGAGGIRSNVNDMVKFARFCLSPDDSSLGRSIQAGWKPQRPMGLQPGGPQIGLGWILNSDGVIWHNGQTGGFHSFLGLMPESKLAVVILTNSSSGAVDAAGFQLLKQLSKLEIEN